MTSLYRTLLTKLYLRLCPPDLRDLKDLELKARTEWMLKSHDTEGFKAYYAARYYGILTQLASGIRGDSEYHINLGRRMELLHMLAEMKQEFDRKDKPK